MYKKLSVLIALVVAASLILSACGSAATPAPAGNAEAGEKLSGTISVSGAFALYPMMTVWAEEFSKVHPDVQFDVQGGGAAAC